MLSAATWSMQYPKHVYPEQSILGNESRPGNIVGDLFAPQVGTSDVSRSEIIRRTPLFPFDCCGHPIYQIVK